MEHSHPLGDDFARWVDLTDDYEARLAHASPEEMPDRTGLAGLARALREMSFLADSESRSRKSTH